MLGLILWLDKQIEEHPVINGGAVQLARAGVEIAQGLRGFLMLRRFVQNGEIRLNSVLGAVLLEETLSALQMLADVCGHPSGLPLRRLLLANRNFCRTLRGARFKRSSPLYTPLGRPAKRVQ
jgi:hypothetical protein